MKSALIDGINWIAGSHTTSMGTGIVNLSSASAEWGTDPVSQDLRDAIIGLTSRSDILLVQAAGNNAVDACSWGFGDEGSYTPGTTEHTASSRVIITGGSDESDGRWTCVAPDENCTFNPGSNTGAGIDLFAPAAHILSAYHGDGGPNDNQAVCRLSGTSMAAPHVSGLAALILEAQPFMSAEDLKNRILSDSATGVMDTNASSANYIGDGSPDRLVHLFSAEIFSDGFESGDTSAWD